MNPSYEQVQYESYPFAATHPSRLATIAALYGMTPAKLANCRVLELGCASGGNLLPLAELLPQGEFVGVDSSAAQIADGQRVIDAFHLQNARLLEHDIRTVGSQLGEFDYIIAHGIFSWIPPEVQQSVLEICQRHLAPQGVAYISYNTKPGWCFRGMLRDVVQYRAQFFSTPADKVREARALADFLAAAVNPAGNPYGSLLAADLVNLQQREEYYLYHEYLEDVNAPLYFHEFCTLAGEHGLKYLGDAEFSTMSVNGLPPAVVQGLQKLSGGSGGNDRVQMEQYLDFVRNRMFRRTLLCRQEVPLLRAPSSEAVFSMSVSCDTRPEQPAADPRSTDKVVFSRDGTRMTTADPQVKASMLHLAQAWPKWTSFAELLAATRARLGVAQTDASSLANAQDARALAETLLRSYSFAYVELSQFPVQASLDLSHTPQATRIARLQAELLGTVTNLRHEIVPLTVLQRHILCCLDGAHDRAAVLATLEAAAAQGKLDLLSFTGQPLSPAQSVASLRNTFDDHLQFLARQSLLLEQPAE
jgi:methyltransferase-like protein/SAM-dependent methyltransferase